MDTNNEEPWHVSGRGMLVLHALNGYPSVQYRVREDINLGRIVERRTTLDWDVTNWHGVTWEELLHHFKLDGPVGRWLKQQRFGVEDLVR